MDSDSTLTGLQHFKTLREIEKEEIIKRMEYYKGNKAQTAGTLGITIKTLYNKMKEYGIMEQYRKQWPVRGP